MTNTNITNKNGEVKPIKLPNTVTMPIMYGAMCAGLSAAVGMIGGFVIGVWEDGKTVIDLIKKK